MVSVFSYKAKITHSMMPFDRQHSELANTLGIHWLKYTITFLLEYVRQQVGCVG